MTSWHPVPADKIADLLGMFTAHGQGSYRNPGINTVTVTGNPNGEPPGGPRALDSLLIEVTDNRHGRWRLHLHGVTVHDPYRENEAVPWDEAASALERGTWEVHDSTRCIYGSGRPVHSRAATDWRTLREQAAQHLASDTSGTLYAYGRRWSGTAQVTITFTAAHVEQLAVERVPGSCVTCGGSNFTLTTQARLPVRLDSDGAYRPPVRTAARLLSCVRLSNVLTRLTCVDCQTQVGDTLGQVDIRLGRRRFTQSGLTLASLLSGRSRPGR